jgi:hypothetical protein
MLAKDKIYCSRVGSCPHPQILDQARNVCQGHILQPILPVYHCKRKKKFSYTDPFSFEHGVIKNLIKNS